MIARSRNTLVVALGICLLTAVGASRVWAAPSASHAAAAAHLLDLLDMEHQSQIMIDQMVQAQVTQNANLAPFKDVLKEFYSRYLSYGALKDEMIKTYTEEFTEPEINAIVKFYESPVGKKVVSRFPAVSRRGGEVGLARVKEHLPELQKMIQEAAAKMKESSAAPQGNNAKAGAPTGK